MKRSRLESPGRRNFPSEKHFCPVSQRPIPKSWTQVPPSFGVNFIDLTASLEEKAFKKKRQLSNDASS